MDRKTVAIIFFGLGCLLATTYFIYPPFALAIWGGVTWFGGAVFDFVMYAPWQFFTGVGLTALVAVAAVKGFFNALRRGNRLVATNIGLQTAPATVMPVGVGTSAVVQPVLEEKKAIV